MHESRPHNGAMGSEAIVKAPAQIFKLPYTQILLILAGVVVLRLMWVYSGKIAMKADEGIQKGVSKLKPGDDAGPNTAAYADPTAGMA